jgi:hypothetical protein
MKGWLFIAFLPLAVEAQLTVVSVAADGTETSVGSSYSFGQVAIGSASSMQFRVYNTGSAAVMISGVTLGGAGFTFEYPLVQFPVPIPGHSTVSQTLNVWVSLTPTSTASFNASLTITSTLGGISTILVGSGVTAPTLASGAGCSTNVPFNWGSVMVGGSSSCTFTLANPNPQAVTVASIVVNGLGFTGPYGVTAPFTLQPGQSASFSVNFAPPGALPYSGTLAIGSQSYGLTGTGHYPPLPTPLLQFDTGIFASGQQRVVTMSLPSPAPFDATGSVNIALTPSTAAVAKDSEVIFLSHNAPTVTFSVSAGATTVLLNGQSSATFATGTTEGTITFTVATASPVAGDPTTRIPIPGTPVIIDSTSASKERAGFLDITIIGADNTYSAGAMSFSFFDTSGKAIGSAVGADFTPTFKTYYGAAVAGSAFHALVSFPVTGSVASIGGVAVTLTNVAGMATTGTLTFQ